MKHIMEKSVAQRYTLYGFGQRSRFDKCNNLLYCIKGMFKLFLVQHDIMFNYVFIYLNFFISAGVQLFDKTTSLDDITTRIGKYFTYVNERSRIVKVIFKFFL